MNFISGGFCGKSSGNVRIALKKYGISRKDLAEKLGLNYTGVNRWFHVDDIAISYIFDIAEIYDLKVKTTIKPKQTGN